MLATVVAALALAQISPKVEIVQTKPGDYQLQVGGKPFFVKGAGAKPESFAQLAQFGANSVRTWGVDDKTGDLLDAAQKAGLKVCVGFWMRKNDGFSYKNPKDLQAQSDELRKWVRKYHNHPALLMWAVGNEVELGGEWPEWAIQTESLAKVVKEEDQNHPVISVVADMWPDKMALITKYWKDIDALGVNSYGGLPTLATRMTDWKKPYFITEWQFSLPEKDEANPWAGALEPSSAEKAESAKTNYQKTILAQPGRVLGSYFFYWGPSTTGTLSHFTPYLSTGEWQPVARIMAQLWGGKVPADQAPVLTVSQPSGVFKCAPSATFALAATASDPDSNPVTLTYEVNPNDPNKRFVGDFEKDLGVVAKGTFTGKTTLKAPSEPGLYRLVVIARDGKGAASIVSRSFLVEKP